MVSVINDSVVNDLSDETNRRLSSILVHIGHVQVIHEIDKYLARRRSILFTKSLVNVSFDDSLKGFGVSVTVEVYRSVAYEFFV